MTIRSVPAREGSRWNLREIVLMAALAVVFGVVYWAWVQAWGYGGIAMGPAGDLAQHIFIGGWFVVAPLAIYIIRKPLTGVVTEVAAAFVEFAFLGSPVGPVILLTGFVQGAGSELPFAVTGYRRYGWTIFALSGLSAALFSFVYNIFRLGWLGQTPPGVTAEQLEAAGLGWLAGVGVLAVVRLILQVVSGVILGGLLAKVLGDELKQTGVLDNFAISQTAEVETAAGQRRLWPVAVVVGLAMFFIGGLASGQYPALLQVTPDPGLLVWIRGVQLVGAGIVALGLGSWLVGLAAPAGAVTVYGLLGVIGGLVVFVWAGLAAGQLILIFQETPADRSLATLQLLQSIAGGIVVLAAIVAVIGVAWRGGSEGGVAGV